MLYQLSYFRSFVTGPFRAPATFYFNTDFRGCQEPLSPGLPGPRDLQLFLSRKQAFWFHAT